MKKLLLGTVGLIALAAPASAADLGRPYTKAPAMVAAIYDWSGFYIGINGGGASSHKCWNLTNDGFGTVFNPALRDGCHDATGGIVGGQIGYRWQAANWVFGLEGQGDWASLSGSSLSSPAAFGTAGLSNRSKIDSLGLITGQVGYAFNNALWYVKGGAAVTNDKYNGIDATGIVDDRATETRWGAAIGTGLEFAFAPNWSVAAEYDHMFMGSRSLTFTGTGLGGVFGAGAGRIENIKQDVDMATVRVNYRWGGPVVAKY